MTTNLNDHISQEAGHYVFNTLNGTEVMNLSAGEAGRCAKGLRLALEGKVDATNLRVVSENDPTRAYRYDARKRVMVEEVLRPSLGKGMGWQPTGNIDPGYTDPSGKSHQVTSHFMALAFLRGVKAVVPVTEWNQNAVAIQVALARTPEGERDYQAVAQSQSFVAAW